MRDGFVVTRGRHFVVRLNLGGRCSVQLGRSSVLLNFTCGDIVLLAAFFRCRLQTLLTNLNHRARGVENLLSFIKTDVEKLDQIIDRGVCQSVDVGDAVFTEGVRLLGRDHLNRGQRHRRARGDHGAHLFGNFAFDFFFAANVNVPAHQLGRQPHVLPALADRQTELVFVDDHFHLPVFDVGNAHLIHLCR